MLSIISRKLYPHFRQKLHEEVAQILRQKKIPSNEDWNQAVRSYQEQEKKWKEMIKKDCSFEKRARIAHIYVEKSMCSQCNRPHFQDGLCLLHFQLRYSETDSFEQE